MDNFEAQLQKRHLKRTKARVMIWQTLEHSAPRTAGEIYDILRKKDDKLSLSTVYRNCEALAEKGLLLRSAMLPDGLIRYEYAYTGHACHAICLACHRLIELGIEAEEDYGDILDIEEGFEAIARRVEIYGYCQTCRKKGKDKEKQE